jgi:hypothetical protein
MSKKKHPHDNDSGMELHFEQVSHHGVRYENRDLGGRSIIGFLIVLMISGATICLVVWGYFYYHNKQVNTTTPLSATAPVMPVANANESLRFQQAHNVPIPLQTDDEKDMDNFRAQNQKTLSSYGWVDQNAGVVRIPIEQAIKNIAQQGLPVRPAQQLPATADFGSGRSTVPGAGGGTRPETRQ